MKKLFILLIFGLLCGVAYSPEYKCLYIAKGEAIDPYKSIFKAICAIESSNDPLAWNKKENARGLTQIREIRRIDYNTRTGKNYKPNDLFNPKINEEIFRYYFNQYGVYKTDLAIRRWNGDGKKTYKYLSLVKSKIKTIK